jgi:A/G-specific adenine glycosylase
VTPHQRKIAAIVSKLLEWFPKNARDLPWRRTTDPYAVYVSEIMLQQTQVKTVIPYWNRWMQHLPTIGSLAKAKPQRVLKLWEGLGYYTRARNLQKAAKEILRRHQGKFPEHFDQVLALPGIGRYTAGAVCSIAFNQPAPILDGNVIRVLTRLFGIGGNPHEGATNARLWALAADLVGHADKEHTLGECACSHLNQALMELGAIVCTPAQPRCSLCPVRNQCRASRNDRVHMFPNLERRAPAIARRFAAFVFENRGRVLVRQRPDGVVNAHLWEFPNVEVTSNSCSPQQAALMLLQTAPTAIDPLCVIKHTITRYRITLEAYRATIPHRSRNLDSRTHWLKWQDLHPLPFTSAHKRILARAFPAKVSK